MPFSFLKSSKSTEATDDIFISYSRSDGRLYAQGIDLALSELGFTCFCDMRGTDAGSALPPSLLQTIRQCKTFILLGSPGAIEYPEHITAEVDEFARFNRTSMIIPIAFGEETIGPRWSQAKWFKYVEGKSLEHEVADALKSGKPSPAIVKGIDTTCNYVKSKDRIRMKLDRARVRLRRILIASALTVTAVLMFLGLAINEASDQIQQAGLAFADATIARNQAAEAHEAETLATQQRQKAVEQANAEEIRRNAAEQSAKSAELRRLVAEADATTQESIADSRSLANASQMILSQHPDDLPRSLSVAVDAMRRFPTVEADAALRVGLGIFPRIIRSMSYTEGIRHTAFSPDSRYFAMVLDNDKLRLYRTGEEKPLKEIACQDCNRLALSNDAKHAAVVSIKGDIKMVDLQNGESHFIKKKREGLVSFTALALSPNGKYLAVCQSTFGGFIDETDVEVLDSNGKLIKSLSKALEMSVEDIAFGPTGDLAIGGSRLIMERSSAGRVVIWRLSTKLRNAETGSELTDLDFSDFIDTSVDGRVKAVALGPDTFLFSTDKAVWRKSGVRQYEPVVRIPVVAIKEEARQNYEIEKVALSHDGTINIIRRVTVYVPNSSSASTGRLSNLDRVEQRLFEVLDATGHNEALSINQPRYISRIGFDPDGERIGVLNSGPKESTIDFFDASKKIKTGSIGITPARAFENKVFVSPNLAFTASAGEQALQVRNVWESKKFTIPYDPSLVSPDGVTFSPDGQFLVLADAGTLGHYNVNTEEYGGARAATAFVYRLKGNSYAQIAEFSLGGVLRQMSLSADGRYLAATILKPRDSDVARIYSIVDGRDVTFPALRKGGRVRRVEFSPNGQFLIALDDSKQSRLSRVWRLANRMEVVTLGHEQPQIIYAFSAGDRYLLVVDSHKSTMLVDLFSGRTKPIAEGSQVVSAAFSPDGQYVAVADDIHLLRVYRTDNSNEVTRIQHSEFIGPVAFSYDNRLLATATSHLNTDRLPFRTLTGLSMTPVEDLNQLDEATENRLRVWFLRREDLLAAAAARISGLPAYAR